MLRALSRSVAALETCSSVPSTSYPTSAITLTSGRRAYGARQPNKKAEKGGGGGDGPMADNKIQKLVKVLEPIDVAPEDLTAEELAEAEARGKAYNRAKMKEHRAWQANLTTKLKIKQAALAALPAQLREAAAEPDYAPFPPDREMFYSTPPMKLYRQWKEAQGQGR